MKNAVKTILFGAIVLLIACQGKPSITGKWNMAGVGTVDTTDGQGKLIGYGMLTMMSNGAEFEFTDGGEFTISSQGQHYATGNYTLSPDGKQLSMKSTTAEENYEVLKSSEKELQLKSMKDSSILNLTK